MKYNILYRQCDHTGEYGLIPEQAPDEWIVSTNSTLLAHDILEHNLNNLMDNLILDEFITLGVIYNYRTQQLDYDILGLLESIFNDSYDGYISDEYLEYHYRNEYYDWFKTIVNEYFIYEDTNYYNDSYDLTSEQIVDRIINCTAYYFKQGVNKNNLKSWCFDMLEEMISRFFKYDDITMGCTIQVIASKEIVRIISYDNEILYCNG